MTNNPKTVQYQWPADDDPADAGEIRLEVSRGGEGLNIIVPDMADGSLPDKVPLWIDTFRAQEDEGNRLQFIFYSPGADEPFCKVEMDPKTGRLALAVNGHTAECFRGDHPDVVGIYGDGTDHIFTSRGGSGDA